MEQDVSTAAARQSRIMDILAFNAVDEQLSPRDNALWYDVVQYGFNFVDEKCDYYLLNLFILDRERGRIKGGLVLLDKTTGAILTVSSISKASIQIVAQAFGFAQGITDIVANSYLFSISPALVTKNVNDAQLAYRTETYKQKAEIKSRGTAFAMVRGYLELCFPQTIEARIEENLSKTKGAPSSETPSSPKATAGIAPKISDAPPLIQTVPE